MAPAAPRYYPDVPSTVPACHIYVSNLYRDAKSIAKDMLFSACSTELSAGAAGRVQTTPSTAKHRVTWIVGVTPALPAVEAMH